MQAARDRRLRRAPSARVAVPLLVAVLSVAGLLVTEHVIHADRRAAASRRADVDTLQTRELLERARSFGVGLAGALEGERAPDRRRFAALDGSAASTVGLTVAMWVERVSGRQRRAYERRIGAPIARLPGSRPTAPRGTAFPATFLTGVPLRRGVDVSGLPALAATLRDPAAVFAGTGTPLQPFLGRRGFFVVQAARFGRGPGSKGFLVVFVPGDWLNLNLNEDPSRVAVSLDGRRLSGGLRAAPAAGQRFEALAGNWRLDTGLERPTSLQTLLPWLAVAWPAATALLAYLVVRGVLRRRRAERQIDDIFDLSLDLLCVAGLDGYFKRVNPAFERTLAWPTAELLSRPIVDFVHPADREKTTQAIAAMRAGQETVALENRYVRPDGAVRWLQWSTRAMQARGLMYAAARDITDTRMLLDEQAALRRVATLVANGVDAGDLFEAVAVEVGRLVGADATRVLRYEPDGTASVVGGHGAPDAEVGVASYADLDASDAWRRLAQRASAAGADQAADPSAPLTESVPAAGIGAAVAAPIVVGGHPWGVIVAAWRRADMARPGTNLRMSEFTELVATAVANAESRAQLAASRRRIVTTADETRRRIERDLHDGAQQRQIQTIFALQSVQLALDEQSGELAELVGRALESAEGANIELRELARGIHPAALTEGGLGPALKALARRSPIPVTLDLRLDGRLPERVEVTAYYAVSEALTNAAKHSGASKVNVVVDGVDGDLRVSVRDDGVGGAQADGGSGLVGLADRVEAAGGTLAVRSPRGEGTDLTVALPTGGALAG
jgi:PAS domain S-box-containing protein